MPSIDGPLADLQILDFSRLMPGPYCTAMLAGMGARVIKVEDARNGDGMRHFPPFEDGVGMHFVTLNRGKQSVALDLKTRPGQDIAQALAEQSDVVVEGFRPGVVNRLGIDFETLSARNPRLVYCSISGYGQSGPLRDLPGHDLNYVAMAGLLASLSPGQPRVPGVQLADAGGALLATIRILGALHAREGGPQYLDVSLVHGALALMPGAVTESEPPEDGAPSLNAMLRGSVRNDVYLCADGRWLALSPLEDQFWNRLCDVLREEQLLGSGQTPTSGTLREVFMRKSCEDWLALLSLARVPCAPIRSLREVRSDLAMQEGALLPIPEEGDAPSLGAHTCEWLDRLGYSQAQIEELVELGVVAVAPGAVRADETVSAPPA